jgi:hypothetical protein
LINKKRTIIEAASKITQVIKSAFFLPYLAYLSKCVITLNIDITMIPPEKLPMKQPMRKPVWQTVTWNTF